MNWNIVQKGNKKTLPPSDCLVLAYCDGYWVGDQYCQYTKYTNEKDKYKVGYRYDKFVVDNVFAYPLECIKWIKIDK